MPLHDGTAVLAPERQWQCDTPKLVGSSAIWQPRVRIGLKIVYTSATLTPASELVSQKTTGAEP
jgi:hypothetical protein